MAFSVGDIFLTLRGNGDKLVGDAEKAGQKAGASASAGFSAKLTIGAALTGAFALATKGAVELDNAVRSATAGLGLAADEQARFSSTVNDLFKSNPTKGYQEIANTLATLRQEWQLGEADAAKYAQSVLNFSKVTGTDGVTAARGLDDALDAFNLTAADSVKLQDALIGAQRAGAGPAAQNLELLSQLAPALQSANLGWEDAIGLLVSFGDAGIDASLAPKALQAALSKVKSPAELQTLIENIRGTEDPFQRAALAADLFGQRAGAKMAQLLKPGSDALKQGAFDVGQFAGATVAGADVIDNSFANRVTGAIRQVTAPLAEMASGVGPIFTGIGTLLLGIKSIGTTLGLEASAAGVKWLAILGPLAVGAAVLVGGYLIFNDAVKKGGETLDRTAVKTAEYNRLLAILKQRNESGEISADELSAAQTQLASDFGITAGAADGATDAVSLSTIAFLASERAARDAAIEEVNNAAAADLVARTSAQAAQQLDGLGKQMDGAANATQATIGPLTALAAWLDNVSFKANVAARNLAALSAAEFAASQAEAQRLRQLGETPDAVKRYGGVAVPAYELVTNAINGTTAATGRATGATKGLTDAAKTHAATLKNNLANALEAFKNANHKAFDEAHDKALRAIADTLKLAKTAHDAALQKISDDLAAARAANAAPVTEAEKAQDAIENARRLRDLQESLNTAQAGTTDENGITTVDPIAVRNAQEALQSFQAQAAIDALKAVQTAADDKAEVAATAATAIADATLTAAETAAATATTAENKHFTDQKARFDAAYKTLQADAKISGEDVAKAMAAGLTKGIPAVEKAAKAVVDAAAAYLPHSPAKKGPFSGAGSPYRSGVAIIRDLVAGAYATASTANWSAVMSQLSSPYTAQQEANQGYFVENGKTRIVPGFNGNYVGAGPVLPNGRPNPDYQQPGHTFNVYNPAPEPASTSVRRRLQSAAAWGR